MRTISLSITIFILSIVGCNAQEITGYLGGSHSLMIDMKELQEYYGNQYQIDFKHTSSFPIYWQYGLTAKWGIGSKYKLGFNVFTTSTGGRTTYSDFSGEATFDQTLNCIGVAVHNEYLLKEFKISTISLYLDGGLIFTKLNTESQLILGNDVSTTRESYKSVNELFEIGAIYKYHFTKILFLEARCGVQINLVGTLINTEDNSELYTYHPLGADWSGAKFSIGIGVQLGKSD